MVLDASLQQLVENYLKWDKNEKFRAQIEDLVEKNNEAELRSRMVGKLTFGTAGVRARMDAGFNRLNDLTIIQLTHGMAKHMLAEFPRESNGVAIGFDGRYNSRRFSELASNVFIRNGIKVYIFSDVVPTPSYATVALKCDAGLMITASHNPKEDNGYKAYWSNGAQIIGPHDVEIVKIAQAEPEPKPEYWDISNLKSSPMLHSADSVADKYFAEEVEFCHFKHLNEKTPLKFTYSAFHGVGYKYAYRMLREYGISDANIVNVKEQADPNPDFPTVPFPNPEEGLKVLKLSIKTADENNSTIILANDPDADRLQLVEKQKNGEWRVFTGNEMGTLLSWWVWKNWRAANPNVDLSKVYMLNSTVSCQIVKTMAKIEGFKNDVTLTGFKWMGNLAEKLRQEGNLVILAWEESIGFMPGHSYDKDGIISTGMFAELATWLHKEGITLTEQLFKIYYQYGFHLTRNSYWMVPNPSITKQIFADHRKDLNYPAHIGNEKVKFIRDLTTGYDNEQPENKAVLPLSTSSEMITFTLENGSIATLRASGTEPKIKYYIELKTEPGKEEKDLQSVLDQLDELEKNVVNTLLQPQKYGLQPRA